MRVRIPEAKSKDPTRVLRGQIGAAVQQSRHDPREYTVAAREAFLRRFWPDDPTLPLDEAERRAKAAHRAHMLRLSYRSAQARRQRTRRRPQRNRGGGDA